MNLSVEEREPRLGDPQPGSEIDDGADREARREAVPVLRTLSRGRTTVLVYAVTIGLVAIASFFSPDFRDPVNLADVLRQSVVLGLVAIGQTFVLIAGGIDMSVGMMTRLTGIIVAISFTATTLPPAAVLLLGVALGTGLGCVNGLIVSRCGAQPFIATLGVMGVLAGISHAITDQPTGVVPLGLTDFYSATWGIVPVCVVAMGGVWFVAWFALNRTRFGRNVYAVGASRDVARLAGVRVTRVQVACYAINGACAALAAIFLLARSGIGDPTMGEGLEFQAIVAAAVGGISLYGGKGSLLGTLGAVLLITVSTNLFTTVHVSAYYQQLALGLIVLVSVSVYGVRRRAS